MNPLLHQTPLRALGLVFGFFILMISFILSIVLGTTEISFLTAVESFTHYDMSSNEHVIIQTTRFPRAIFAALIGGNLAVAGALMQALTRNPLASPSIFGINSGAVFFVILALTFFPVSSLDQLVWVAFLGAGIGALTVYFLGSLGRDGLTPLKIVLAGAAMTALFTSFTQGMLVVNEASLQNVLFWLAGSVAGKSAEGLIPVLPYMVFAGITALVLAQPVNILTSGEDVAKGLGQRTGLVKISIAVAVILLAGSSVAVAGSIGFVGLVIPHIARFLVGIDYRWVIPYSAVLGAILLLLADIIARFVIMPGEIPIGVMTALIGVPFFIYTARKGFRSKGVSP
ncbi:iron ABC transporter permease [Paenibacillus validus]|uniref:Iron chelate uptake ABC transporter family permease subunit n=1 Tax=Paenibacillus validus TaxID=44253 RepID=A0A7X2ZD72_9BACL|nr:MULTISPECIES: iron ABC transporter permease [Paenibacillus]MED4601948.1 iron ABC transporter permease [Paenibacillus validus]MED4607269.1 iron ABC transporter permease [Paenibacillus validus]MUG72779.1 iron chelate uptake ABC transporter family permease subunit [Paenibacillus validus]